MSCFVICMKRNDGDNDKGIGVTVEEEKGNQRERAAGSTGRRQNSGALLFNFRDFKLNGASLEGEANTHEP